MWVDRVAIDASPLITLFRADLHPLLPQLFSEILIPESVWSEVVSTYNDSAARGLPKAAWAKKIAVSNRSEIAAWNLGAGETATLSLALSNKNLTIILDDRSARRCARVFGISAIGTAGIIVLAKRRGIIDSIENALRQLQNAGLWLSDAIITKLASENTLTK